MRWLQPVSHRLSSACFWPIAPVTRHGSDRPLTGIRFGGPRWLYPLLHPARGMRSRGRDSADFGKRSGFGIEETAYDSWSYPFAPPPPLPVALRERFGIRI
jgi:hypothetical protein